MDDNNLDNIRTPRYTQISTFMRLPYNDYRTSTNLNEVDIGLIGIPFDGGVTNRPGARLGPKAVREASSLTRIYNNEFNPYSNTTVCDLGDVVSDTPYDLKSALDDLSSKFNTITKEDIKPVVCGGDHCITLPVLRSINKTEPIALIHFDAHCDTGGYYLGSDWHHGTPFRHAINENLIDPKKTIQIGIRGSLNDPELWSFSYEHGVKVITMEQFEKWQFTNRWQSPCETIINKIIETVDNSPAYISFDVDCLDPVYAPGTGTPEIGGFTSREALQMLRGLKGLNIIGGDVVEVSPPFDTHDQITALTGATIMYEILCLVAANEK